MNTEILDILNSYYVGDFNTIISETLDPLQFAYRPNKSTDDAISMALNTAFSHLDKRNTYTTCQKLENTVTPWA